MAPVLNSSSGPVIRLVPGLVAIEVAPAHHYFDKTPEGPTELGFSYAFLAAVGVAFVVLICVDVYAKHGPKPTPGERVWYKRKFDKAKGGYYVCKDTLNRLFVRKKQRLDLENAVATQRTFDSQKIIDRLAAKPAAEKAPTMVEGAEAEEKSAGPMAGIEVRVTPLDMPFLRDGAAVDTAVKDGTPKSDDAGGSGAAGL
ncbi:uncharacterized protein TrAtP1_006126 [Trichoderma atroviride]|uniref:Uncharacterized protein n=1 Tax=Hypocrea atroviridis (strain ATCC 20476 / IMI 206040) TaxID=452589 RepID=G9PAP9_HYPAI|nr:uncharacterized protein TRIATDRAFT_89240 [Trichoderma atroviride IMI 206040]EHK40081.1 hypothetical protein TRIATDRAFT_89240 [Trichoderma atroviride IMI 206040]UKZ64921.1 hypothetical protein TrAtP1_006126 [Trichoderma atroviride]